jgi:hypothetical protein
MTAARALAKHPRCHCGAAGAFGYKARHGGMDWSCAAHRLRQWSADACLDTAEADRARLSLLGQAAADAPKHPPDLQELVTRYGGYDKIPPDAWAAYDLAMEKWQSARRGFAANPQRSKTS